MVKVRHLLSISAVLALAGCVAGDPGYGYSDAGYSGSRGYSSAYPSTNYPSGYAYERRPSYDRGREAVDCDLPGRDQVMARRDCRRLQRDIARDEYAGRGGY